MSRALLIATVLLMVLSGCVVDYSDASPADYERAKADCEPHGGLKRVRLAEHFFHREIHIECFAPGVSIIRPLAPPAKHTTSAEGKT
jgi:hypothetical protein